ncbi:MAG TPA: cupin domain-containing protein [Sphingomicrobium sp.]|jgi:mannose-6-phosphate isomerase-like protein (cupin superfamily)|nr:cupin domain-containing protein [Sphingomicrobium sp.]
MDKPAHPATPVSVDPLRISRSIDDAYHNQRIASVNDHEIRMSVMTSAFPWHRHPDSDETFFCVDGELVIELDNSEVTLRPGEFLTVPKGVRHRTRPGGSRSVNLTFEKLDSDTLFDCADLDVLLHPRR